MLTKIDVVRTGNRIRLLMHLRNVSVEDMQAFLGFTNRQGIYHWFRGRSLPDIENIYAISNFLAVPVDLILCGEGFPMIFHLSSGDKRLLSYFLSCQERRRFYG